MNLHNEQDANAPGRRSRLLRRGRHPPAIVGVLQRDDVYPDSYAPYDPPPLAKLWRVLMASFRLGRLFGVEVRLYWSALILLPLYSLYQFWSLGPVLGWPTVLGLVAFVNVGLYFIIYTHEMSHIAAGWYYKLRTPLITLSPLGGLAHMSAPAPKPSAEVWISLAGPAVHLVWLALIAPFYFGMDAMFGPVAWQWRFVVEFLFITNGILALFNLLPLFPMDGGRVLRAFLATRVHPNRATLIACKVGIGGAVLLALYGLIFQTGMAGGILIMIAISNVLACRQAMVAARHQPSPYGGPGDYRQAWEQDPDAWKQGYEDDEPAVAAKDEAQAAKAERERQQREEEVDRILAKITEVGMGGLTRAERKALERASKEARERSGRTAR